MSFGTKKTNMLLLGMGAASLFLVQLRCAVALLAWVYPISFLLYLKTTSGWRSRLLFVGVMVVSFGLTSAKYVGAPLPPMLNVFNAVVFGLLYSTAYLLATALGRHRRPWLANLGVAGVLVIFEWLAHRVFDLGGNTAIGYSQLDNLSYLQTASLFGLAGLSFLIYWFAAAAAHGIHTRRVHRREVATIVALILAAHIFGAYRIGLHHKTPTVKVAAVTTDWSWFPGDPFPKADEQAALVDVLFMRSERAAKAEAKLVLWPEVAAWIEPRDEDAVVERGRKLAAAHHLHLVAAYILPKQREPLLVENKYVWIEPNGQTHTYLKHIPLPMEPSIPGEGVPKPVETDFGTASGAICWDADFPSVIRRHSAVKSVLLVLPSADTPGVDPYHTQIAGVRAIENGFSVLRSTRNGLSAGFGPRGRIRGWQSANESDEDIFVVTLPAERITTLYSLIGDALVWLSLIGILLLLVATVVDRIKTRAGD